MNWYKCLYCGDRLQGKVAYKKHRKIMHNITSPILSKTWEETAAIYRGIVAQQRAEIAQDVQDVDFGE